jgi:hypothetical protein
MKLNSTYLALTAGLLALPAVGQAQVIVAQHYPAGVEGIKGASVPPAGFYLRDYNVFYNTSHFADGPTDFNTFAYINGPRLIWMTDAGFLGADYGMDLLVPFGQIDYQVNGKGRSYFGIGDLQFEPVVLAWHKKQLDLAAGFAIWAPTGDYTPTRPDILAKGFWGAMLTAGGTYFFDEGKTWAFSLLNRYEIALSHQGETEIYPGQAYTLEWGFSKTFNQVLDVGVVGFWQQQTTRDSGNNDALDRVVAVGPEISYTFANSGLTTSLRYEYEFAARERPYGSLINLTVTKRF